MDRARLRLSAPSRTLFTLSAYLCITFLLQCDEACTLSRSLLGIYAGLFMIGVLATCIGHLLLENAPLAIIAEWIASVALATLAALTTVALHRVDLQPPHIAHEAGGIVTIDGTVTDMPDRRPTNTRYVLATHHVRIGTGTSIATYGRVLVSDYGDWPRAHIGDTVRVTGTLERPAAIDHFRYDRVLAARHIYAVVERGHMTILHSGAESLRRLLTHARDAIERRINLLLPEPDAALLAGLLLGTRGWIPADMSDAYQRTGLTHMLAVSGFNVTLVLLFFHACLCWLAIRWRVPLLILGVGMYALLTGADPPVVRAAIMGTLGLLAILARRGVHTWLSILWTAALMTAWNPRALWFDPSFQLSFLAVIGLTTLTRPLTSIFKRLPDILGMRTALVATLAAQIATLPLTILTFRQFSLVAPFANMLIAPFVPVAMLLGSTAVLMSAMSLTIGRLIGFLAHGALLPMTLIPELLSRMPFAALTW